MSTLLESKEALRARALEVNLTEAEADALINNRVDSLARLGPMNKSMAFLEQPLCLTREHTLPSGG